MRNKLEIYQFNGKLNRLICHIVDIADSRRSTTGHHATISWGKTYTQVFNEFLIDYDAELKDINGYYTIVFSDPEKQVLFFLKYVED